MHLIILRLLSYLLSEKLSSLLSPVTIKVALLCVPNHTALFQPNPQHCLATLRSLDNCIDGHCGNYIFISHRFLELSLYVKLYVGFM